MGFLDIFRTEKKEVKPPVKEIIDIDEIIKGMEKAGIDISGELGKGHAVVSLPLASDVDIEAGRTELMNGNIVIFRIDKKILYSQYEEHLRSVLSKVKQIADSSNGDVRQIADDRLLVVPAGIKIVRE